jgi:cytoskeleton protein RodZ
MAREEGGVDIGARLRAARERKGLTVLQSAEKLHVDARLLEALEGGDFAAVGADVYVRGHLRRYAELVGESGSELQTLYSGAAPANAPDLTRIPRADYSPESSRLLLPALVGVIALALAGLVWWLVTLPRSRGHQAPATVAQTSPPVAASGTGAPLVPNLNDPAPDAGANPVTQASPGAAVADPSAPASGGMRLAMSFSGASWVKVWDGNGKALIDGLMASGSSRTVQGAAPLRLVLGNAAAVTLALNDRPLSLQGLVRKRGDAHVSVDAAGNVAASAATHDD